MSVAKERKINDEGRFFNSEWHSKYLVVPRNQSAVCHVCQNTIAVMKDYDINRHFATNHSFQFVEVLSQARLLTLFRS